MKVAGLVGVRDGVGEIVARRVFVAVGVSVGVSVDVGVREGVADKVGVLDGVGVSDGSKVEVGCGVSDGVRVGVEVLGIAAAVSVCSNAICAGSSVGTRVSSIGVGVWWANPNDVKKLLRASSGNVPNNTTAPTSTNSTNGVANRSKGEPDFVLGIRWGCGAAAGARGGMGKRSCFCSSCRSSKAGGGGAGGA